MSSTPIEKPGQIGSGNDMDMIKSYGGAGENRQSSTLEGGALAVNTVPTNEVNKNPDSDIKSDENKTSK